MATTDNTALAPAAERFKQLQAESARVPFDEIKAYLRACTYDVLERTGNDEAVNKRFGYTTLNEDAFRVAHDWTENGVRYQWAQLKLLDLFLELDDAQAETGEQHAPPTETAKAEEALRHIETARRLADVCGEACKALDCGSSSEISFTMGTELFEALDDARKALGGGS